MAVRSAQLISVSPQYCAHTSQENNSLLYLHCLQVTPLYSVTLLLTHLELHLTCTGTHWFLLLVLVEFFPVCSKHRHLITVAILTLPPVFIPYFNPKLAISISLRKEEVCQTNTPFSFKTCSTKIGFYFMTSMLAMGWVSWHLTDSLNFPVSGWWINKIVPLRYR